MVGQVGIEPTESNDKSFTDSSATFYGILTHVVVSAGYDPATSRLSGARSNQLSYETIRDFIVIG